MIYRTLKHRIIENGMPFLSVLSILFVISLLLNISATRAQSEAPNFRNVVLFATNSIELKEGSVIQSGGSRSVGDIVVNSAGPKSATELTVGVGVSTSAGANLFADSIEVQNRAEVAGDVSYNDMKNKGNISGNLNTPLTLPVFGEAEIPSFVYGTPDENNGISVKQDQSLAITPGDYGDIDIKKGGALILDGAGIYNARSIKGGPNTAILIDAADEVKVRVVEDFTMGQTSKVGPGSGSGIDASNIIFYVTGDRPGGKGTPIADFGEQSVLDASIYVKEGRLALRNGTSARGSFFATDIDIGSGTMVTFNGFFGNEPPVAVDDNYSINEDTVLSANVLDNDTDADGDPMTAVLNASSAHGILSLNSNGTFTYTPDDDYNGPDSFTYRASDGVSYSNVATVSIEISPVADAPVAADDSYTVNEDSSISIAAPGILDNDTDADGDSLTVIPVSGPDNGSLTLNPDGSFDYTPDADFNGPDSFTYKVSDGAFESNEATVTINVNPVNDTPVATNDDYDVIEDGVLTVHAPGVLGNDTDIDGDTLTAALDTGSVHGVLVLNGDGSFTYTPETGFYGSDSFTYVANDGTVDSNVATVAIAINELNHMPVAEDDSYSVDEDSTLTMSAPGVLANDTDADGDPLTVDEVEGNAANVGSQFALASGALLTVDSDGGFTYETNGQFEYLGAGEETTDSFVYRINDGKGETDTATVTVTITGVNDAPTAADKNLSVTGNVHISVPDGNDDLLFNVIDPDTGDIHTITTYDTTSTQGGDVTLLDAGAGTFSYNPPPGFEGSDSFGFTVSDNNGGTDTGSVYITVDDMIFFINGSAGVSGDGRLTSPFDSLAAFEVVNGNGGAADPEAGDIIFLYTGSYSGGVTLENDQTLVGQGATDTLENIAGITLAAYSDPLPSTGGIRPDITNSGGNVIGLASNNTIRGLNIVNTASSKGINGTGVGTLTINEMIISGTGDAAYINGGILDVTLDSLEVSGGTSTGINLASISGSFIVTDATTITSNSGISVTNSPTMTCDFSGGITITSTAGNGLLANNAGTVTIGGSSSIIEATGGAAVHVSNIDLGSGWTFRTLSSNGGTNGIFLDNTGSLGGLTVTGDGLSSTTGGNGSGGTIDNSTEAGIFLKDTQDVSLNAMVIEDNSDDGIFGRGVTNFSMAFCTVQRNGNASPKESGIQLGDNTAGINGATGNVSITDSKFDSNHNFGIDIDHRNGTITSLTVSDNTISNQVNDSGFSFEGVLSSTVTAATISGNTFIDNMSGSILFDVTDDASADVDITGNAVSGDNDFGQVTANRRATLTFDILNNGTASTPMTFDNIGITVNLLTSSEATALLKGTIDYNFVNVTSATGSGRCVSVAANGAGTLTALITNNTLNNAGFFEGIRVIGRDGSPVLNTTITGNTVSTTNGFSADRAIVVQAGAASGDSPMVCADIGGSTASLRNTISSTGFPTSALRVRVRQLSTFRLPGFSGSGTSTAAVEAYLNGRNTFAPGNSSGSTTIDAGRHFDGGGACAQP